MDYLENIIFKSFDVVRLDASFPGEEMYLKRGYEIDEFHKFMVGDGDYLCFHSMKKMR